MYDTHAHLNFPQLRDKIDQIVQESKEAGLTGIIVGSSNLADSKETVALARKYPGFLYASVGIHPQKTDPENKLPVEEQLSALEALITDNQSLITAVGETGLDFSEAPPGEENRTKEEQEILFKGQIALAQKFNLPLVIHARQAIDKVVSCLQGLTLEARGVFHCYAGGKKRIQKILNLPGEWCFGFDGNLTYDEGLQNTLKFIPEDKIIIETDSPYLTPVPHRGEINSPVHLPLIQEKINEVLGKNLSRQVEENTRMLFGVA